MPDAFGESSFYRGPLLVNYHHLVTHLLERFTDRTAAKLDPR